MRDLARELAANQARLQAIISLLQDVGLFDEEEYERRVEQVWRRDLVEIAEDLWQRTREDESEICLDCGARCCKSSVIVLSPTEAETLWMRGEQLLEEEPEIHTSLGGQSYALGRSLPDDEEWIMPAYVCAFLSRDNHCLVYDDRPDHCRYHPRFWREDCPLSQHWYYRETDLPKQPLFGPPPDILQGLARSYPPKT
jgi:Fe-S-cluster containining protein